MASRHNDDDDPFDERGILKDGRSVRVSMMDAEAVRHRLNLHDGAGHSPGHRPGFAFSDVSIGDEREQAYADYEADLTSAYKMDAGEGTREGDICTVKNAEYPNAFGSPGHLRRRNGKLVCVPDEPRSRDTMTVDQAYAQYEKELSERWKGRGL